MCVQPRCNLIYSYQSLSLTFGGQNFLFFLDFNFCIGKKKYQNCIGFPSFDVLKRSIDMVYCSKRTFFAMVTCIHSLLQMQVDLLQHSKAIHQCHICDRKIPALCESTRIILKCGEAWKPTNVTNASTQAHEPFRNRHI